MFYILKDKQPILVDNIKEWLSSYDIHNRIVKNTYIRNIRISTVFLAIDNGWNNKKPLLFETMIFGLPKEGCYIDRYSTWEEAEKGHEKAIKYVLNR